MSPVQFLEYLHLAVFIVGIVGIILVVVAVARGIASVLLSQRSIQPIRVCQMGANNG